jgi:hypothetical protein
VRHLYFKRVQTFFLSLQVIVVWSADHFLKTFTKERFVLGHDLFQEFLCGPMLEAINNTKIFEDAGPRDFRIGNSLVQFFACFNSLDEDSKFWSVFLKSVFSVSWGPIPLFYLTRAVSLSSSRCHLDEESIQNLKDFVTFQLKCQEPMIRGAAQSFLLETVLNWIPSLETQNESLPFPVKLMALADFISAFHGPQKILIRGTPLWTRSCIWIKETSGLADSGLSLEEVLLKLVDHVRENQPQAGHKVGLLFVLLFDVYHDDSAQENILK